MIFFFLKSRLSWLLLEVCCMAMEEIDIRARFVIPKKLKAFRTYLTQWFGHQHSSARFPLIFPNIIRFLSFVYFIKCLKIAQFMCLLIGVL